jgi:hypothetical protein
MKPFRATIEFCLAADSLETAAALEDRLIEAAEQLGIFFEFVSTDEMSRGDVEPGTPLARALRTGELTG